MKTISALGIPTMALFSQGQSLTPKGDEMGPLFSRPKLLHLYGNEVVLGCPALGGEMIQELTCWSCIVLYQVRGSIWIRFHSFCSSQP